MERAGPPGALEFNLLRNLLTKLHTFTVINLIREEEEEEEKTATKTRNKDARARFKGPRWAQGKETPGQACLSGAVTVLCSVGTPPLPGTGASY